MLALVASAWAADEGNWNNLAQLKRGDRIGVIGSDMKRTEGRFVSFEEGGLSIETDQPVTIAKDRVVRVYRRARTNRVWRTAIGAGIGVAAGAVLNATIGERFRNEGQDVAGALIASGAGVGAGLGALSGGGNVTVYRRR
jgi:hypothetical protein